MQQQNQELDQRVAVLQRLFELSSEATRKDFSERMEVSWIHHDSALEGVVYSRDELVAALRGEPVPEATSVQTADKLRQNKAAIDLIRTIAADRKAKVDADTVKDIYACLAPDEVDGKKPPTYRKDIPLHRLYFHEIAAPDKIAPLLKQFGQWLNSPEARRTTHVVRLAAKAHFHLMQIYPYPKHSGKVARLVMNLLLLQGGFPPAIIHSTDRQRYYDALKTNENALALIVKEAIQASVESAIKFLEANVPPPPPPTRKSKPGRNKAAKSETARAKGDDGPADLDVDFETDDAVMDRVTEKLPSRPQRAAVETVAQKPAAPKSEPEPKKAEPKKAEAKKPEPKKAEAKKPEPKKAKVAKPVKAPAKAAKKVAKSPPKGKKSKRAA